MQSRKVRTLCFGTINNQDCKNKLSADNCIPKISTISLVTKSMRDNTHTRRVGAVAMHKDTIRADSIVTCDCSLFVNEKIRCKIPSNVFLWRKFFQSGVHRMLVGSVYITKFQNRKFNSFSGYEFCHLVDPICIESNISDRKSNTELRQRIQDYKPIQSTTKIPCNLPQSSFCAPG